jgi:hypothetical protein
MTKFLPCASDAFEVPLFLDKISAPTREQSSKVHEIIISGAVEPPDKELLK